MAKHILIVDDDEDDRLLFCEAVALVDPNHTCSHARNGEDALYLLRKPSSKLPDFIFLILTCPD